MRLPHWLQWRSSSELDEEIAAHVAEETQAGIDRGLSQEEARYAALRKMGNTTRLKERARESDAVFLVESLAKDVRYALRNLRRNPGFTLTATLSLALGIGVNCAIFSFVDAMLLRPLDVAHPGEIVQVHASTRRYAMGGFSYREYAAYRDKARTLAGLIAEHTEYLAVQLADGAQSHIAFGDFVSGNYFSVFGVPVAMGRTFLPEEDSPAAKDLAALVSADGWRNRFQSDPNILGRRIQVNGEPVTIVGVLPERFLGTSYFLHTEVYLPLAARARVLARNSFQTEADPSNLTVYGRLKPGIAVQQAQAEFTVLAKQIEPPATAGEVQPTATVLPDIAAREQGDPDDVPLIYTLLGIAGMVLLVACLNVANLLLGRASARVKEITIRQSVGASRGRLIAQMLTESAVLGALGAGAGLLLASWAIHFFAAIQVSPDFSSSFPVRVDGRVVTVALAAAAFAVFVSGLWPAIRATRVDLNSPLKSGRDARHALRGRGILVSAQTALATMLLVSAALFVKSFVLTSRANPGFRVDNVLVVSFDPALGGYTNAQAQAFYAQVEERVSQLPQVRSAAFASSLPMGNGSLFNAVAPAEDDQAQMSAMFDRVEPGYFATMAVPILKGRPFGDQDRVDTPGVAIVNQALAERFWPNADPVGRKVKFGPRGRVLEVVGVAANGKYQSSVDRYEPYLYVLNRQYMNPQMTLFVHTAGDPAALTGAVREAVKAVAPDVPVYEVHTMREIFHSHGLLPARLMALTVGGMGAIGLLLGIAGLYAVMAFAVTRRTREIGIRMALGATARSILQRVLGSGLKMSATGVAIGLAGALLLTRYLGQFLDRVSPHDPAAFLGVPLVLAATAVAACWAPARRASRVDPAVTLRYE